jgi:hypothetical protein
MRINRSVRFDFCGSTVLVVSHGHTVSFNTTVGFMKTPYTLRAWTFKSIAFPSGQKVGDVKTLYA